MFCVSGWDWLRECGSRGELVKCLREWVGLSSVFGSGRD